MTRAEESAIRIVSKHGPVTYRQIRNSTSSRLRKNLRIAVAELVRSKQLHCEPGQDGVHIYTIPGQYPDIPDQDPEMPRPEKHALSKQRSRPTVCISPRKLTVVIPDPHYPIQDQRSIDAVLSFGRDIGADHYICCGDACDFHSLSTYSKEAARVLGGEFTLWDEAKSALPFWEALVSTGGRVDFIPGNHEQRLQRFIDANIGLHGHPTMSLRGLMQLPSEVHCHEWGSRLRVGRVYIEHGDLLRGSLNMYGANAVLRAHDDRTTLYGHTHRIQIARKTSYTDGYPKTRMAASIGHLSDPIKQTWIDDPQWQQGFCLIESWTVGGKHRYTPHVIEIINNEFSFGGRVYNGKKCQ